MAKGTLLIAKGTHGRAVMCCHSQCSRANWTVCQKALPDALLRAGTGGFQ
jgi:hypothetical protein